MENKTYLRTIAKTKRKELDTKKISQQLCDKLRQTKIYQNSQHIMLFYPTKYEIDTLELLNDNKQFYLPKVQGKNLLVCPYVEDFTVSKFNIKEPCSNPINPQILDLAIVPALLTDKNNYRLGYGGGFYDRFLNAYPNIKSVTLLPAQFCIENLPHNEWDIKIDIIISI